MKAFPWVSWLITAFLLPATGSSQDICRELTRDGVYDLTSVGSSNEAVSSYFNWFCDQKFSDSSSAESFGANIGLPFKGVPVKLGFDSNRSQWSSWYQQFCATTRYDQSFRSTFTSVVRQASSAVLNAFDSCLKVRGLHVWLERVSNPQVFRFAAQVNPDSTMATAVILDFVHGPNIECTPTVKGQTITPSTFRARCVRRDTSAVDIAVNATRDPVGGGDLYLPEVWTPPPPSPHPVYADYIKSGQWFSFHTNDLEKSGGCIGSLLKNSTYEIAYTAHNKGWIGKGPHGDGQCPPKNQDYLSNDTYNCSNFPELCDKTPERGWIVIWGGTFNFDESGNVFLNNDRIGYLVVPGH